MVTLSPLYDGYLYLTAVVACNLSIFGQGSAVFTQIVVVVVLMTLAAARMIVIMIMIMMLTTYP
jgi:hypothetical protein